MLENQKQAAGDVYIKNGSAYQSDDVSFRWRRLLNQYESVKNILNVQVRSLLEMKKSEYDHKFMSLHWAASAGDSQILKSILFLTR
jgi:hypothetical protein